MLVKWIHFISGKVLHHFQCKYISFGFNDGSNPILLVLINISHTTSWLSASILKAYLRPTNRILNLIGLTCLRELNWNKKVYFCPSSDNTRVWKYSERRQKEDIPSPVVESRWLFMVSDNKDWGEETEPRGVGREKEDYSYKYNETSSGDHSSLHRNITKLFWQVTFRPVREVSLVECSHKGISTC